MKRLTTLTATAVVMGLAAAPALAGGYYSGGVGYHGYYGGAHFGGRYHHHGHGDTGAALAAGLIFGAALGYALNDHRRDYRYDAYAYDPYYERRHHRLRYAPPRVVYAPATPAWSGGTCLQQREYQTRVTVGGREVEAYGPACLQPDGSWVRGPARLVPNY
jgi:surface antigen